MIFDPIMSLINGLRTKVGNAALTTTAQDLSGGVNELNDQKANESTAAKVCNDATAPEGGIPAESYYYHNGTLYYTDSVIAQGASLPQGTAKVGFNDLQNKITAINKRYLYIELPGNTSKTMTLQGGGRILATLTIRNSLANGYEYIFLEGYGEIIGGRSSATVLAKGSEYLTISFSDHAITFENTISSNAYVYIEFIACTYTSFTIA